MILKLTLKQSNNLQNIALQARNIATKTTKGTTSKRENLPVATLIDGRGIANRTKASLKNKVKLLRSNSQMREVRAPKLGYILVGGKPDSHLYVKMKKKV
jgi:hypothetical protein